MARSPTSLPAVFGVNTSEVVGHGHGLSGYTRRPRRRPGAPGRAGVAFSPRPTATPAGLPVFLAPARPWPPPPRRTFKDTGGSKVPSGVPTSPAAGLDSSQGYFYTVGANDSVPETIKDTLKKVYTPTYNNSQNPVAVASLKVGQQIYPRSEYPWGRSYIGPIFRTLKQAYDYKKNSSGRWHTTLAIFGPKPVTSLPLQTGFMYLARLLTPFWPSEAFACTTMNPPTIIVTGFVNVDITAVTANDSTCDDCNYTFPKTI